MNKIALSKEVAVGLVRSLYAIDEDGRGEWIVVNDGEELTILLKSKNQIEVVDEQGVSHSFVMRVSVQLDEVI